MHRAPAACEPGNLRHRDRLERPVHPRPVSTNSVPVAEIRTGKSWDHFGEAAGFLLSRWVHASNGNVHDEHLGYMLIVDAVLTGTGAASTRRRRSATRRAAARCSFATSRRPATSEPPRRTAVGPSQGGAANIAEYATPPVHKLWGQTPTTLNMVIKNTPEKPWSALSNWTVGHRRYAGVPQRRADLPCRGDDRSTTRGRPCSRRSTTARRTRCISRPPATGG